MRYIQLGQSDLRVSELCLGTMTFGQQNTEAEAHQQLDLAWDQGINFLDAAEMYPVPPRAETQGLTERYIGSWLARQQRDRVVVATKIVGPSRGFQWIRNGQNQITPQGIETAVNDSLRRLRTDYIDLYQIHWPDRYVPLFGQSNYNPTQERETRPIEEQLQGFVPLIKAGKIRYLGVSNETSWGVCEFCYQARQLGLPQIVSIQNAYNLLNRLFESGLAETCRHEQVGLLAYSPLGFGILSGKYLKEAPATARMTLFSQFGKRYRNDRVVQATAAYMDLAQHLGISPVALALAFVRSRWFVTSTIIGATSLEQLKENISSLATAVTPEIETEIEAIHQRFPNPAP